MLAWPIDHAFYLYILFLCVAAGFLAAWWTTRKRHWVIALGVVTGFTALLVLLSLVVDTDRKQIERALRSMAENLDRRHFDRVFTHVSEKFSGKFMVKGATDTWNKQQLREHARRAVHDYHVDGVVIREVSVEFLSDSEARVTFRAKPELDGTVPMFPCEARFARETDGQWRMTDLRVFNPFVNSTELFSFPQ
jgi:hypothetical protein